MAGSPGVDSLYGGRYYERVQLLNVFNWAKGEYMPEAKAGTRHQAARQETRRLILEAAYRLFEARGYEKTTMRTLAAEAGVGLGTIFQHFPSKDYLLVEAFETDVAEVVEEAVATMPLEDIRARLLHLAGALYRYYARRPTLSRRFIGAVQLAEGEAAAKLKKNWDDFALMIEMLIEEAAERGETPPGLDTADAAAAFCAYYIACLGLWLWSPDQDYQDQLSRLERLVNHLFRK